MILSFSCAMNPCIFFHWILYILLLKPCPWLYQTKCISSVWKIFQAFPYMIFHSYLWSFPAYTFTLSPLAYHIFHEYKYSCWSTLSLYEPWKNLAVLWSSCTETAVMLTSIVSLLPCTSSSFLHQSFLLDNVTRMDSA